MRILSLCSGIGGLELGLHQALPESRVVAWVERDPFCQKVLRARMRDGWFEEAPIYGDLTDFPAAAWAGRVDLVSGGFPCQPWSHAGQRRGTDDERWLWPAIARIVGNVRPAYCFLENVPGLISGGGLGYVLSDLAALGLDAEWTTVRASDVGAPHQRERVFILAHAPSSGTGWPSSVRIGWEGWARLDERGPELADPQCLHRPGWRGNGDLAGATGGAQSEAYERERRGDAADDCEHALADARRAGLEGRRCERGDAERQCTTTQRDCSEMAYADGIGCEGKRVSGLPDNKHARIRNDVDRRNLPQFPPGPMDADAWRTILAQRPDLAPAVEAQSSVRRMADGSASRVDRLKACGNAVVPSQAELAFRVLWQRLHAA